MTEHARMSGLSVVIEQGPVKRKIEGDFRICASRATLERIARVLNQKLEGEFYYGWVEIRDPIPHHPATLNSEPLRWVDPASRDLQYVNDPLEDER